MTLPSPPRLEGISWRPATVDDAARISDLQQACFESDGGYRMTPEEFRNELENPDEDLAQDSLLALGDDGAAVAFVLVQLPSSFEQQLRIFSWDLVHPDHRGLGLAAFLFDWYEARGLDRASALSHDGRALFWKGVYDWQKPEIERLETRGYEAMRYFIEMIRDLSLSLDPVSLPNGYELRPWPDDSEPIRLLHNEAFKDHWGAEPRSEDEWRRYQLDEFFRQDLSAVVMAASEPVAYLHSAVYPHDFEDRGRTEAWVEVLGTAREHRKKGLASSLINNAFAAYRNEGFEYAAIGVDSDSLTGAVRLYQSLGFETEKRSIAYGKYLR